MTWKYGLKKYKSNNSDNSDKDLYEITEIFGNSNNKSWVKDSLKVLGESPEEVIEILEVMLKDLKGDLAIVEDNKEVK